MKLRKLYENDRKKSLHFQDSYDKINHVVIKKQMVRCCSSRKGHLLAEFYLIRSREKRDRYAPASGAVSGPLYWR